MGETLSHGGYLPAYEAEGEDEKNLYDQGQRAIDTLLTDILENLVDKTNNQSVGGLKTFLKFPVTPATAPISDYQVANKRYVDDKVNAGGSIGPSVPSGAKMLFYMATAPNGWSQDVSVNDKVLRVVSGQGGGSGGNWNLTGISVGGHALSAEELNHSHNVSTYSFNNNGYGPAITNVNQVNASSANAHSHPLTVDGNWRPAYIDVIICIKN
jgi:hypothetical protein